MNYFEAYPIYLKATDIADALQIHPNTAREMMKQSKLEIPVGPTGRHKRVQRDKFFEWWLSKEGKALG